MFLLESIIKECQETEADATQAENSAQGAYEDFVKETNNQIGAMQEQIANDEAVEAKDTKKEVEDEGDKRTTEDDIDKLEDLNDTIHEDCDFTVNNFDKRTTEDDIDKLEDLNDTIHE